MKKYVVPWFMVIAFTASGQSNGKMDFETYNPPSTLVVPEHKVIKAKFPFIDVHNHQFDMPDKDLSTLILEMDKLNMKVMVNLSGQSGQRIRKSVANIKANYPQRFIVFANVDFNRVGEAGWGERAAKQLEEDVKNGANGLKIYKNLGFSVADVEGKRVKVDDPRLDAVWKKAGASELRSYDVSATEVDISVSGSSKAYVRPLEFFFVEASGNSFVYYRGNPNTTHFETSGNSKIIHE